jgi:hypothetical protein
MNLLSPIVPQDSGLFPWIGGLIDATGGQYEGFKELDQGEVARLIARARHVEVVPSFQCNVYHDQQQRAKIDRANMELMLATARMNVPTNTVDSSRQAYNLTFLELMRAPWRAGMMRARRDDYCEQEVGQARSDGRPNDVIVLLSDRPRTQDMAPGVTCSPLSWARYCVRSQQ